MESPAPSHYRNVTDALSPDQCQDMVAQNAPENPTSPQQLGILLRQLTSIHIPVEAVQQLEQTRQLQEVVQTMSQRHGLYETLFAATDDQLRGLHSQHRHLMRQLEQFEIQQEGRWVAYTEADKMQQASLRNTISDVQRLGMMVDQSRLDSIRSELALLQEAVGTLQASSAACDAKLDLALQSRQQGEGQPRPGDLTRPAQRDAGEQEPPRAYLEALSGHRRQIEVVVKQLQEEKRLRSILEDKLEAETAARQAFSSSVEYLGTA